MKQQNVKMGFDELLLLYYNFFPCAMTTKEKLHLMISLRRNIEIEVLDNGSIMSMDIILKEDIYVV